MILGVMQGRLSPPVKGEIQEFPKDWKNEFVLLKGTGLQHIDWIVTKKSFSRSISLLKSDLSLLPIRSICADNMMDKRFCESLFLKENLKPICEVAVKNKIYSITIPLLEDSSISDDDVRKKFTESIKPYSLKYPELIFSFECECSPEKILQLIKAGKNFRVTYDTGNITSSTKNPNAYNDFIKKLIHKIDCVHLKDRTFEGKTVEIGNGDTNFAGILMLLRWFEYEGDFTLQIARGRTGHELTTVLKQAKFFKKFFLRDPIR